METTEAPKKDQKKRGWLRTNVEAFAVAIAMALVIKTFAIEAFQVPTESMEPTIIGRTPGGNHLLVDKGAYYVRDPERFEIVVFRYDLSRPVNYVKRCAGMPGESVAIAHGDLYASKRGTELAIARKPDSVLEAIFATNPVIPESHTEDLDYEKLRDYWAVPKTGASFKDGSLVLDGGKDARLVPLRSDNPRRSPAEVQQMSESERSLYRLRESGITAYRRDEMAATRGGRMDAYLEAPIGDVRIELEVTPAPGCGGVLVHLTDGTRAQAPFRLRIAVEGAEAGSELVEGGTDLTDPALAALRLPAGKESNLTVDNVDDRFSVRIDGDLVWSRDYVQPLEGDALGRTTVSFGVASGQASFARIAISRDLYYTEYPGAPTRFEVPDGHYLFLGDNSANSLDARGFRVAGIRFRDSGRIALGDMEAVSDDLHNPRRGSNPYLEAEDGKVDESVHHFIDVQGNRWRLEPGSYDILDLAAWQEKNGQEVMDLHGRTWAEPDPAFIGFAAVDSARLRALAPPGPDRSPHGSAELTNLAAFSHFTPRRNVVGRAFLTFWPPSRWGCVR